jgi:muramoyltetrapeptide carboxypeptidase
MDKDRLGPRSIKRRMLGLLGAAMAGMLAGTVAESAAADRAPRSKTRRPGRRLIKPRRLAPGDVVGLLAPAGHTDEEGVARAIANVETLGMRVKLSRNLRAIHGNFAGSVQQRLDDLHAMFADPEVKALWAVRGGSGCIGLLPGIDYKLIRKHPKILLGYSDITALHLAIHRHTGLVMYHGPVASSTLSAYSERHLRAVLMAPEQRYTIAMAEENRDRARAMPQFMARTVRAGSSTGRLIGGNLCLVSALVGTPYAANFHNSILFLEEINEVPYRIDRMMAQLQMSQGFEHAAALMLGVFENCEAKDSDPSLTLAETLDEHLSRLSRPAVTGYSFGHIRDQFTLPIGLMARLDTEQQTLTLLEPAVL